MPKSPTPSTPNIMLTYDIRREEALVSFKELLTTQICQAIIIYDSAGAAEEASFQLTASQLIPLIQEHNIAAIIAENTKLVGRLKADGLHMEEQSANSIRDLEAMRQKLGTHQILGYGDPHNRHNALNAGEAQPDYMFFGKLGKDKKPDPHPRNLNLASWWAEVVQLDCVVQAGSDLASLQKIPATGADFVALEEAIFSAPNAAKALQQAQNILAK